VGSGCAAGIGDPVLGEELGGIPYSSSITVNLMYDEAMLGTLPRDSASWFRRAKGGRCWPARLRTASFLGRTAPGKAVLRAFLGGRR